MAGASAGYSVRARGRPDTLTYRLYVEKGKEGPGIPFPVSTWHDVPLYADQDQHIFNMIVEIPRWSNTKFEIARDEPLNPIKQDVKNGTLRSVRNLFPYKGYIWNYGALPGSWEDPSAVHLDTQHAGDNDPLDACEIGECVTSTGQVKRVKVLGAMALLDDGETDWKVIVIDVDDPSAAKINDIDDVEEHFPGLLAATKEWFTLYKVPEGKKANELALNGEFRDRHYALSIIDECRRAWERLIHGDADAGQISLTTAKDGNGVDFNDPEPESMDSAEGIPTGPNLDKWFFLKK